MGFTFKRIINREETFSGVSKETLRSLACKVCPLRSSPKVENFGNDKSDILFLGEAPGETECRVGQPFVGASGEFLKRSIADVHQKFYGEKIRSFDINKEITDRYRFANVIKSRPPRNRTPTEIEIECCTDFLKDEILKIRPKVVCGLGNVPLYWMTKNKGITVRRGRPVAKRIEDHNFWFIPTYHPSYLIRRMKEIKGDSDEYSAFLRDIQKCFEYLEKPEPFVVDEKIVLQDIEIFYEGDEHYNRAIQRISDFKKKDLIAVDIETSSDENERFRQTFPLGRGSRILSISFSDFESTISLALDHPEAKWSEDQKKHLVAEIVSLLSHKETSKIAHNLSFELTWFAHFFGYDWFYETEWHDTQAQEYVINGTSGNRESLSLQSLNNLCQEKLGFDLKSLSGVDRTKLIEEDINKVLLYNGADSKFTYLLHLIQYEEIEEENLLDVYKSQIDRTIATSIMTYLGVRVDFDQAELDYKKAVEKSNALLERILASDEAKQFQDKFKQTFNPNSSQHCGWLFGHIMKKKEVFIDNGRISTSNDILKNIEHPIAKDLTEFREVTKIIKTYLEGVRKGGKYVYSDGKIHPRFNTTFTATRRLSSNDPNVQNYPKRKNAEIRKILIADKGNFLISADYGQIEARVVAMASGDSNLIDKLKNRYDIHAHWAREIIKQYPEFKKMVIEEIGTDDEEKVFKRIRYHSKNKLVFPALFGSSFKSIAANLGIPERIVKRIFDKFWSEFPGVSEWHKKLHREYKEDGILKLLTGFRRFAPLKRKNAVINTPIQGTAFDIVSSAIEALSKKSIKEKKLYLHPIINVHDELVFNVPKDKLVEAVEEIVIEMVKPRFDFIKVPLVVEVTYGENWFDLEEIGEFSSEEFQHDFSL